jgi:hypothetical protein
MPKPHPLFPTDYGATLKAIQQRVRQERTRVILSANAALILLYWDIGRMIVERQSREGWGAPRSSIGSDGICVGRFLKCRGSRHGTSI